MFSALSLLRLNLSQLPRRRHFHAKRGALAALSGLVVMWYFFQSSHGQTLGGLSIFHTLVSAGVVVTCLAAPMVTAGVFTVERENRTLGLLLMSDMTPGSLVLGRLAGGIWSGLLVLASSLPLLLVCVSLGGVEASQVAAALAILGTVIVLGASLGLLASSLAPSEKQAAFWALVMTALLYYSLPMIVLGLTDYFGSVASRETIELTVLPMIAPQYAMQSIVDPTNGLWGLAFCPIMLGLSTLLLAATRRQIRRAGEGVPESRFSVWLKSLNRRHRRDWTPIRETANPLAWKEQPQSLWLLCGISLAALMMIAVPYGLVSRNLTQVVPQMSFVACALIFGLGVLVRSSLAFTAELEGRTLDLLVLSGMSADDIIMGKLWGYISAYLPWLTCMGVSLIALNGDENFATYALGALVCIVTTFAYSTLAMNLSLAGRRTLAMFAGLSGFGLCSIGIGTILASIGLAIAVIVIHLIAGIWLLNRLYRSLYTQANIEA